MKHIILGALLSVTVSSAALAGHNGNIVSIDNSLARHDAANANALQFDLAGHQYMQIAARHQGAANAAYARYNSRHPFFFISRAQSLQTARREADRAADNWNQAQDLYHQANISRGNAYSLLYDTLEQGTGTRSTNTSGAWNTQWYAVDGLNDNISNADRLGVINYARQARPFLQQGWTGQGIIVTQNKNNAAIPQNVVRSIAPQVGYSYNPSNTTADYSIAAASNIGEVVNVVSVGQSATNALHVGSTGIHAGLSTSALNKATVAGGVALVMDKFEGTSGGVIVDIMNGTRNRDNTMNLTRAMSPHGVLR